MRFYSETPVEKVRRLQAEARARRALRLEQQHEHNNVLRDLAEMVFRTLRRRRFGDGPDPS